MDHGLASVEAAAPGLIDRAALSRSEHWQTLRAHVAASLGDVQVIEAFMGAAIGMALVIDRLEAQLAEARGRACPDATRHA